MECDEVKKCRAGSGKGGVEREEKREVMYMVYLFFVLMVERTALRCPALRSSCVRAQGPASRRRTNINLCNTWYVSL